MAKETVWKLRPYLKKTPWAGTRLAERYGESGVGEAYLLSAVPGRSAALANGVSFRRFLAERGEDPDAFPLLVKVIDAARPLSVQVHPEKEELWLIEEVYGETGFYVGFRREVTAAECRRRCGDGSILSLLRPVPAAVGGEILIPRGAVHTAAGAVFLEIQTNSDVTYRLFDYGRGRGLRLSAGLAAADLTGREARGAFPFQYDRVALAGGGFPLPGKAAVISRSACGVWGGVPFAPGDCLWGDGGGAVTGSGLLTVVRL